MNPHLPPLVLKLPLSQIPVRCFTCGKVIIVREVLSCFENLAHEAFAFAHFHVCKSPSVSHSDFRCVVLCVYVREQVIGNKWESYLQLLNADYKEGEALEALELRRYCCRRMFLTHVELIDKLLQFQTLERKDEGAPR